MRRGRRERIKHPPVTSAVAPGVSGGQYKPLSDSDIKKIQSTVLDVLENIGMADPIDILKEKALERGCHINEHNRLCFPRSLVEDVIANTPKKMTFYGKTPNHDLELGGKRVHTYGGGEAVNVLEVGSDTYRPSTLNDIYDAARLVDKLDNIHAFSRLMVATEIQDQLTCDINTAYASVCGTAKHTALTFNDYTHVAPVIEMLKMIAGGEKQWFDRPFCHGGGCPVLSPLRYGRENSEVCVESVKFGAPVWIVVAPQAGATAPSALAGAVTQCVAEAIASLLLVEIVAPGHPVIVGPWPFVSDLRTGAFSGGGGEEALVSAAAAQVINHYGLVSSVAAGMTDAKVPDNQAGFEKGIAVALAALTGCNNVSESAGMVGSLMGLSFESLVIDNDMLGTVLRAVRGIEVNDETLSYDVMAEVVHGDGHYLRHPQTLNMMRSEYEYPSLSDRRDYKEWQSLGAADIRTQSAQRVKQILSSHYPELISSQADKKIRDRFPILLAAETMSAEFGRW
ncbi:MAG: methyltransferase [Gammaproteobacteria bacterium]|nr:methyltransferase [Gammaproteobacteria bacterium]